MKPLSVVPLIAVVVLAGCDTHHAMVEPNAFGACMTLVDDPDQAVKLRAGVNPQQISSMLDARVELRFPTAMTVARLTSTYGGVQIATLDADELNAWEKTIAKEPRITRVLPLSPVTVKYAADDRGNVEPLTLGRLREAAARQQSELLLVYVQADSQVENLNHAAGLYWTGVGLFLAPGTVVEHKTVMQAILVDTRSGMILGSATGDSHRKRISAAAFTQIQHDKLSKETPKESLEELQVSCGRMIADVLANARRIQ